MTEPERIIKSGLLRQNFLDEETRSGVSVSSTLKKIWAVELEMLCVFDNICKKHNLKYFLAYGTLLGAVRHKGFIPWDDDVDVVMFRDDYDKLLLLHNEFKEPLFLQHNTTDKEYCASYARIRNSNTTAISKMLQYQKMNHGIFLDVFPLDNSLGKEKEDRYCVIDALNRENGTFMKLKNPNLDEKNKLRVKNYSGRNPIETLKEIDEISRKYNHEKTDDVICAVCTVTKYDFMKKEDLAKSTLCEYEGLKFPIPVGYDSILTEIYGNYMQLPNKENRICHSHYFFDPDKSYKEYV